MEKKHDPLVLTSHAESVLFLRVFAAADYFTSNTSLMENVPPVVVDLILDPFLLNMFPRSLVPTAIWTLIIAIVAYFIGGWITKTFTDTIINAMKTDDDNDKAMKDPKQTEDKKKR
jgi:glucan phosphoethanolaminetransferase (alkaline phosphatase superfamily)